MKDVRIALRVPKLLHAQRPKAAKAEGVSLNTYILRCLAKAIGRSARV